MQPLFQELTLETQVLTPEMYPSFHQADRLFEELTRSKVVTLFVESPTKAGGTGWAFEA